MLRLGPGPQIRQPASTGVAAFSPASIPGIKLWVKSDSGISSTTSTFVNQVVISGAGTASSDGTYTRSAGGINSFSDNITGNSIYWDGSNWIISDQTAMLDTYNSSNLTTWTLGGGSAPAPTGSTSSTSISEVTAWTDQSGQGNNLSVTATSPTIESNIINGLPAIKFNGGRLDGIDIVTAKTIYAVLKTFDTQPFQYSVIVECTGGGLYSAISGNDWGSYFGTEISASDTISANTPTMIASLSDNGIDYALRRDGSEFFASNNGQGFTSRSALYIGNDGSSGQPANVYVSEIIIYNNVISAEDITNLETYLNNKYAFY